MELPIVRVTCLEDRAQVERQGELELAAGLQRVRVEPVSALAVDRSLKVELAGATLVDARVVRAFKPRPPGGLAEDASALKRREHELEKELERLRHDQQRQDARLQVVRQARADVTRAICESAGADKAEPAQWAEQLDKLFEEENRIEEGLRLCRLSLELARQRLEEVKTALHRAEAPAEELGCAIELSLEAPAAGRGTLKVSYLVPCALWRPAYRATLLGGKDGETVAVEAEAVVWQRTGEEWRGVDLVFSTARPTLGASPPRLTADQLSLRDKSEAEKQTVEVSIREEEIQTVGEAMKAKASEMPGLDDGGEVRVLASPHKASIPSDGQPHRVPLFQFQAPARAEQLCAPERSPLASLVARFENKGSNVLLAGPVDLMRESGFVGRGQLPYAAMGEPVKLSFGSEDAVRVVRDVSEKSSEARLTGRKTTKRTVKLFVSNTGTAPVKLAVEERIPVSEIAAVEVKLLEDEASPRPSSVSRDGIVRYELALEGRAQKELQLPYEVSAAAKVVGLG